MSQRQGVPQTEAAAALELLTLREEINNLALREARLKLQVLELEQQIASYETAASRLENARETNAALANDTPQRSAALQAQLDEAQEQLAQISAEKDALTARQQAVQKRLKRLHAGAQSAGTRRSLAPRREPAALSSRQRSQKRLILLLSGLALIAVVVTLIRFARLAPTGLSLLSSASSGPAANAPMQAPPFFTPAKTAPTNQGCITTIKYSCYSPEYIQQALELTPLYKDGYDGSGQTIVLIGAGDAPTLQSDIHKFDLAWGLPDPEHLSILYPDRPPDTSVCANSASLAYENTVDVEWAHAIAPGASIVLLLGAVQPSGTKPPAGSAQPQASCAPTSLQQDIAYALADTAGDIISINDGSSELAHTSIPVDPQAAGQKYFAAGHLLLQQATEDHVTVVAAAGDSGATNLSTTAGPDPYWTTPNVSWPASDPDALAVGGTVLTQSNDYDADTYAGETAWSSPNAGATGGGLSAVFAEPDYQKLVPNQTLFQGKRGVPDVTFPAANLLAYDSAEDGALVKANPEWQHWDVAAGTSIAAAAWAGLIAIADQMRGQPLGLIQPALYSLGGQDMHDITNGDNSYANVPGYQAQKGYDLVSGWGTPIANTFVPALLRKAEQSSSGCDGEQPLCP